MVLAALGVAAVGGVGSLTVRHLSRSAERSTVLQSSVRHYEAAILSRSAIDTDILRAATGGAVAKSMPAESVRRAAQLRESLAAAREGFTAAGLAPGLVADFDAMATAMGGYTAIAVTLTGELVGNPSAAPAHLAQLETAADKLEATQTVLGDRIEAQSSQVHEASRSSARSGQTRTLLVTGACVAVLLLLAALINRRSRQAQAAKAAAEAASTVANHRLVEQVSRQRFTEELREALDAALDESMTLDTVERALNHLPLQGVSEVLLADSSRAHVRRAVATSDAPGCGIASPWDCPAVRGGRSLAFDSSEALRACPHLQGREGGPLSATCIPLLFNGRGIGVLHSVGPDGQPPDALVASELAAVATETATRIGTIRILAKSQFQAKTDGLTGMSNRRTLEEQLRQLVSSDTQFTLAMADLDHFKLLNDTYGHEAGDRALRVFSTAVHDMLRGDDIAGRFGGEEFVFAFPELTKDSALVGDRAAASRVERGDRRRVVPPVHGQLRCRRVAPGDLRGRAATARRWPPVRCQDERPRLRGRRRSRARGAGLKLHPDG